MGRELLDDVKPDICNAPSHHSQRFRRGVRDVDNSSANVWTAIIDPDRHRLPGGNVCHAHPCAKRQRRVSGGQFVRIEFFAARGLCALRVETGNSLRCSLEHGWSFLRRERGMLFHMRETPVRDE